jgi:hypothetical protein
MFETWLGTKEACKTDNEPGNGVNDNPEFIYAIVLPIESLIYIYNDCVVWVLNGYDSPKIVDVSRI